MARSAEAIRKRALKRNRTEQEQRIADAVDTKKKDRNELSPSSTKGSSLSSKKIKREKRDKNETTGRETTIGENAKERESRIPPQKPQQDTVEAKKDTPPPPSSPETQHNTDNTITTNDSHPLDEPGAWKCPSCENRNFASRRVCHSKTCDERRPEGVHVPPSWKKMQKKLKQNSNGEKKNSTKDKMKWKKQAGPKVLAVNEDLRRRYLESNGGEGMEEEEINRAKILIERSERKKKKKEMRLMHTSKR